MSEAEVVRFEVEDGIGVITVDNPPVNALGPGVREGIIAGVERGMADPQVTAMVLIGAGRSFIAGADIRQFGKPRPMPARRLIANPNSLQTERPWPLRSARAAQSTSLPRTMAAPHSARRWGATADHVSPSAAEPSSSAPSWVKKAAVLTAT